VKQGATTIWERWDGIKPDGTFQDARMNSFNHYSYGAIGEWMYRTVAGIGADPAEPGYRHVLIRPQPGGGLTLVRAGLRTRYGEVASAWEVQGDSLRVTVRIPANAWATVWLPAAELATVREAGRPLGETPGVSDARQESDAVVARVGAGAYRFDYPAPPLAAKMRLGITFTLDDTIGDLLARPAARAVLERRAPAFTASLVMGRFLGASLRDASEYFPQLLPPGALAGIAEDLRLVRKN
jgi:hypothetical protein